MPNALLSRFDLLFLILDLVDNDLDADLARHITYVHKHMRNPQARTAVKTFDKDFLKAYISQAKKLEPRVPVELTSYIVEAYVGLRQQDAEVAENEKRTHVMTARQLLSQDLADFSSCALSQLAAAAAPAAPAEGRPDKVLEEQAAEEVVEVAVADPPDGVLPLP